jgi:hypothetical protein
MRLYISSRDSKRERSDSYLWKVPNWLCVCQRWNPQSNEVCSSCNAVKNDTVIFLELFNDRVVDSGVI